MIRNVLLQQLKDAKCTCLDTTWHIDAKPENQSYLMEERKERNSPLFTLINRIYLQANFQHGIYMLKQENQFYLLEERKAQ